MKKLIFILVALLICLPCSAEILYQPDLMSMQEGETLSGILGQEGEGFIADGQGGLVSANDYQYNAIYFGVPARQYHYHAEMEPVNPGENVVGGLSMKVNLDIDPSGAKRMDLAVTTGGGGKSILIYAFGTLIADNRNTHQGGTGESSNAAFNSNEKVYIDLYGDRNYAAVFINGQLMIENILPLEGRGYFGLRSSSAMIRYSNIYIETLDDTLLDGRPRYYPETFETIEMDSPETLKMDETGEFIVSLHPENKAYDSITWTIDGNVVMDENELVLKYAFSKPGEYTVSCVVDRQRVSTVVSVND